jgi:uncharacterized protein involved in tellurium resistance
MNSPAQGPFTPADFESAISFGRMIKGRGIDLDKGVIVVVKDGHTGFVSHCQAKF